MDVFLEYFMFFYFDFCCLLGLLFFFVFFCCYLLVLVCVGLVLVGSFGVVVQDSVLILIGLDMIIVIVEYCEQNLQEVLVLVGVVQGECMCDFIVGGDDILLVLFGCVLSLYVEIIIGCIFLCFYICGFGNIDFYLGVLQLVLIIQDDVVLEYVVLKFNLVYDVDQVEVLCGLQGLLFGCNIIVGIIKFDILKLIQDYIGWVNVSYVIYNSVLIDGGFGGLINDIVLFCVLVLYQYCDDYVDNIYKGLSVDGMVSLKKNVMGGFDDCNVCVQLLLILSDQFLIFVLVYVCDYEGILILFLCGVLIKGLNKIDVLCDQVVYDEVGNNLQVYKIYGGLVKVCYDFGVIDFILIIVYEIIFGYSCGDIDGGVVVNFLVNGVLNGYGQLMGCICDLDQWIQEFCLVSYDDSVLQWQVGVFYFNGSDIIDFYQCVWFLQGVVCNLNNWVCLCNKNILWVGFGQLSYVFIEKFIVIVGLCQIWDEKYICLLKMVDIVVGVVIYKGCIDVKMFDIILSWDLSVMYQIMLDVSVYVKVVRGFRGLIIQGCLVVFNVDFIIVDFEIILFWEVGVKSSLWDNCLCLNVIVFIYIVNDIQFNGNDLDGNGVLFNVDKVRVYGFEVDMELCLILNLILSVGLSLLYSEIKDKCVYVQVCGFNGQVVCMVNDLIIKVGVNIFVQIDGNLLLNVLKYNVNLVVCYDFLVSDVGIMFVFIDWNKQGYISFVLYDSKEFNFKGDFEGGLKIGYLGNYGVYEVVLFVCNIINEKNFKGVIENYMVVVYNELCIVGVLLNMNW